MRGETHQSEGVNRVGKTGGEKEELCRGFLGRQRTGHEKENGIASFKINQEGGMLCVPKNGQKNNGEKKEFRTVMGIKYKINRRSQFWGIFGNTCPVVGRKTKNIK